MDQYLTMFSEQLDKEFKPESLFPAKKFSVIIWLYRKFNMSKYRKKLPAGNCLEFYVPVGVSSNRQQ